MHDEYSLKEKLNSSRLNSIQCGMEKLFSLKKEVVDMKYKLNGIHHNKSELDNLVNIVDKIETKSVILVFLVIIKTIFLMIALFV